MECGKQGGGWGDNILCLHLDGDPYAHVLRWFPKMLHDINLSEEYYGENVLHMGFVAEDASLVKWLLDIGSDFHR